MAEENKKELEASKKALNIMATDKFKRDFRTLLRTRTSLMFLTTVEERRFLTFLEHFCRVNGYQCFIWDCFRGLIDLASQEAVTATEDIKDPMRICEHIVEESNRFLNNRTAIDDKKNQGIKGIIYVLLDYFHYMQNPNPDIERRLKSVAGIDGIISTIITGPTYASVSTLENLIPVIDFPFPNREEIRVALHEVVNSSSVSSKIPNIAKSTAEMEDILIDSVSGLPMVEAESAFAKSIVCRKKWDIPLILEEKQQIIKKSGILEFYDKQVEIKEVGGLKELINWIRIRKDCFSREAAEYGLSKPRGLLTIGMPGCGKSLVCKAIANSWGMPLLRLDFGKLFDSLVGQSEARARSALKLAEHLAPCVLWIDEIEKGLSGVSGSGRTDGGTTSRVLSTFLTWMQEKTKPVFVVATANDHQSIPSEFLRAGRFDEIFFVDLPNINEREEVFSVLLQKNNYDPKKFDLSFLAEKSNNYSGAEIEKAINNAKLIGFSDKRRRINNEDIVTSLLSFKSLFEMRQEDFVELREWADERCRLANAKPVEKVNLGTKGKKQLVLDD